MKYSEQTNEQQLINELIELRIENAGLKEHIVVMDKKQRQLEENLLITEERYRSVFENTLVGIYQSTPEGQCLMVNPSFAYILGYDSAEELLSLVETPQLYVNKEDRVKSIQQVLEHGAGSFEIQVYRKDESKIWVSNYVRVVRDKNANIIYLEGTVKDITQHKQTNEELNEYRQHLEEKVVGRTLELKTANERLQLEIIERKRAEEALFNQFSQMSTIFDSINALVYVVDMVNYEILFINKYGMDVFEKGILGKKCYKVLQADQSVPCSFCTNHLLLREGVPQSPYVWEFKNTVCNRWLQCIDRAITWIDGRLVRLEIAFDITERKLVEEKMKLNEQRLKALLKLNQMTKSSVKEIGDFALEEAVKLTGSEIGFLGFVNENETIWTVHSRSKNAMEICVIKNQPAIYDIRISGIWAEAVRQRRPIIVNNYSENNPLKKGYPKGHVPITSLLSIPIFDGDNIVMVAAVANKKKNYDESDIYQLTLLIEGMRKIIQRNEAVENLRLSEERFFKAFNFTPASMTIYSLDSKKFIEVNESCLKMHGYDREEFIGCSVLGIKLWVDIDKYNSFIRDISKNGIAHNHEIRYYKKSGEISIALLSGIIIELHGEQCILAVKFDITEIRQYQKELLRLDRLSLIGEMAAGIAHEIRNPMTIVKGFLQILGERKENQQNKEYYDLMIEELNRANSIISEFLSLAKNKTVALKMQNLNSIIEAIYPLIQADAMINDIYIKLELEKISDLLLDEKEIRQLILNLVRNGLEAITSGGNLTIRTYLEGSEAVLAVQDRGNGIPAEILDKIGTPFFTTKDNGTGLGLATCYSIAARQNASIKIDTGHEGTTFYVRFKLDV
ncbi:MAG: PAS domain S-box protein [Desulfosporosinus sp.]|nr:PAS domain S-box protein [Desulfosporosinus sp.]